MIKPTNIEIISAVIFGLAILHTFSVKYFKELAHKYPNHSNFLHLLGEVEAVFGIWAMILITTFFALKGKQHAVTYLNSLQFTEPVFVFVIMVIAASKPILDFALFCVTKGSHLIRIHPATSFYFLTLFLVPLLGSFITEPAAMTLGALILKEHFYSKNISNKLKYATIGVLFVNVSVGGVLTQFAAPPVLMVAAKWNWDLTFMFINFGERSIASVFLNSLIVTFLFRKEINKLRLVIPNVKIPFNVLLIHLILLAGVVIFVHDMIIFIGIFLIFMAVATSYKKYQNKSLFLRESFLVSLFLCGLVILGGQQKWWLQPLLSSMTTNQIYYAATALTAITDNAALTYLGSLVDGLSDQFKYALVAGAVSGGGLTVIANAPNPAGYSILCSKFKGGVINPLYLLLAALGPTIVVIFFFNII